MRVLPVLVIAFSAAGSIDAGAQTTTADMQTAGGIHSAVFRTPQGSISVYVASDAAPGDTLSGVVLPEPAGATEQEREANLGTLTGHVVEWQEQEAQVSSRQYQWTIPAVLRAGAATLILRDSGGRAVSQVRVPVDPVPPVRTGVPPGETVDLPTEGQPGRPAIIRGSLDGVLTGKEVTIDAQPADLLASSPRQLVFRVPANAAGPVAVRFRSNDVVREGAMRVMGVRLTATSTNLLRGQTATLTATLIGLRGLTEPLTLTLTNRSADVVQVQDGNNQTVIIQPRQVQSDGTVALNRRLTGVRAGAFLINAAVASAPLTQFDVPRVTDFVLTGWQASTAVRIAPDARELIRRSIVDARRPLEEFLRRQQALQADVREIFESLVRHYCFDLRDEMLQARRAGVAAATGPGILLAVLQQPTPAAPEIIAGDVRRWSFSQFLSRLVARFSTQPVGYLYVSSEPERAPITIDGQRKSEVTNRRFVTSVGEHLVVVARPSGTCRQMVTVGAFQTEVVACEK